MGNCFLYKRGAGTGGGSLDAFTKTVKGEVISLIDSAAKPLKGLRIFGKTTQNGTPTPDAPVPLESVGDGGSVGVTVLGKNLLDMTTHASYANGIVEIEYSVGNSFGGAFVPILAEPGKTYTFSYNFEGGDRVIVRLLDSAGNPLSGINIGWGTYLTYYNGWYGEAKNGATFTIPADSTATHIEIGLSKNIDAGEGKTNKYSNIQLEVGSIATAYEPYKEPQILTIQAPNGLPGIPVTSGGNYTDENGQQWVCDEVDFAQGKYVQRIGKRVLNGSENWTKTSYNAPYNLDIGGVAECTQSDIRLLCDQYPAIPIYERWTQYDYLVSMDTTRSPTLCFRNVDISSLEEWKAHLAEKPVTVLYVLADPIETPLSAEELAQYAALHTNLPNTTIYNDAGAGMEVKYTSIGG